MSTTGHNEETNVNVSNHNGPWGAPTSQGLYDAANEHEACGVGFIVAIDGRRSHKILRDAETLSLRMNHRGACACDNDSGDGAGVLSAIPHSLYASALKQIDPSIVLPSPGKYATGIIYMDRKSHGDCEKGVADLADSLRLNVFAWRTVPTRNVSIGQIAKNTEPYMRQIFVAPKDPTVMTAEEFELQLFILRKRCSHSLPKPNVRFYICSLSTRTVVYKGQFTAEQLWAYFPDLSDPEFDTYLALVHTRFSTNTFPSWERAHPLRTLAHNGEINTLRGNVNLMKAREGVMSSDILSPEELVKLYPVVEPGLSDSGSADCVLEWLVHMGKRSLPEAVMTMVPEAWSGDPTMPDYKRAFYQWAACAMEPWDGPALISFTDGKYVGAILDRNGLRPSRFYVTKDNIMVMASEVGVYDVDPANVILKSRLKPGRMLLVDTEKGTIIQDVTIKKQIAELRPHAQWLREQITLDELKKAHEDVGNNYDNVYSPSGLNDPRLPLYSYTPEIIRMLLLPMLTGGKEALGSMGNDAPLACLSNFSPLAYDYFKQLFAQVTNPPIDPFRERCVMSLQSPFGPEANTLNPSVEQTHRIWLERPILSPTIVRILEKTRHRGWSSGVLDCTWPIEDGAQGLDFAIQRLCKEAEAASYNNQVLILSDREAGEKRVPIGSLLSLGAVHHHLIETRRRMAVALVVHTAEAREVHQICLLLGYGADAICPYLTLELAAALRDDGHMDAALTDDILYENYARALETGILKVMAKMGISTIQSYKGAQIFEAVGLADDVIDRCFKNTPSRIGGVTLEMLGTEALIRHRLAYQPLSDSYILREPGDFHWTAGGEKHINEPVAVSTLREAAKNKNATAYSQFREAATQSIKACTLRGQLELVTLDQPISIEDVEPASEIVKRFATGAMSLGSISAETHQTLAIAMNKAGAKSNTGEGGEVEERFTDPQMSSAIKQVASGRFGVTAAYLAHSTDLQIKMAQGAKPGEGGELPGHKVTEQIARTRHSTPGVGLVSPPPHHDIYSIEDLAELIYDLKCANPNARISVKLVSEVGVGVVAAGVAKGKAEHIVISGHDGGTGASSWTGIKHAGLPWELGVAETHQTLVLNNLRSRIVLQADGQIRTGYDVIVAALLGADEFGFSTAPLIALGCIMMRKCHLNTCPVGIATQDPILRKKFQGQPEHVLNYLFMLAEEVREHMASLGVKKFQELVGRTDLLRPSSNPGAGAKAKLLNLRLILQNALHLRPGASILGGSVPQDFQLSKRLDQQLIELAKPVVDGVQKTVDINMTICNEIRAFTSTLNYQIALKYKEAGLPDGHSINVHLDGSAGQSFCAFLTHGTTVTLEGDANDYVGKGLSGGTVIIYPPRSSPFESHLNVIVGNVCLYGATRGRAYLRGIASERFAVRNSGATAVVEGVGDHGCEYMTGGTVLILGLTGRNFAAGMSGGIAYVLDVDGSFPKKCNKETVELVSLNDEDATIVLDLLKEFSKYTQSVIAADLIEKWPQPREQFVKVFPYEYQRVLKARQAQKEVGQVTTTDMVAVNGNCKPSKIMDIEDTITDKVLESRRTEKALDKLRGFMKYPREVGLYRAVDKRVRDWDEIYDFGHVRKGLRVQAARCMECGVPFCQSNSGCPLGNLIPKWNLLVFQTQWEQALKHLLQTNNFPEFTGRVCPAPCEAACVLGISDPAVTIKNIECTIIDFAFENGWVKAEPPKVRTSKKVAIVGSGPAGLAAAHQLNKAGHNVVVFERNDRCGGLLQYGIPTMKLDKKIVARRIDLLREEGIVFKTNVNVGDNITLEELSREYDALVLSTGATTPRDLPILNRQLNGVLFAMEFLESWQKRQLGAPADGPPLAKDKHVIVIGGGDTGCDCVATSLRQGAASVTQFEILPEPPQTRSRDNAWPQWPRTLRIDYGHEEVRAKWGNDPRKYSILAQEFVSDGKGNVTGIKATDVKWERDSTGRWVMNQIDGADKVYRADLVLLALGFLGPERVLAAQLDLPLDPRGNYNATNYRVKENVFAAGDCRRGQSLVVWAIAEGRQCAKAVDEYLQAAPSLLPGPGGVIMEPVPVVVGA